LFKEFLNVANEEKFTILGGKMFMVGSRAVSVLDSGAEGPGFKSQPRRCRATVLGKLFTSTRCECIHELRSTTLMLKLKRMLLK